MDNVSSEVSGYSQNLSTVLWMSKNSTSHSRPWHVAPSSDRDTVGSSTENCLFFLWFWEEEHALICSFAPKREG